MDLETTTGRGREKGKSRENVDKRNPGNENENKEVYLQTANDCLIPHDYGKGRVNGAQQLNPVSDDSEICLRAPYNMVCSPSSLKIAEHCLQHLKRGVVFIPPPLSLLPTLAAVASSFLSVTLCDHRVVIVCEPDTDIVPRVASYLEFTYGGDVSVDTVRRDECERLPRLASLAKKMARIVIIDSFEFLVPPGFALLIVLGPGTTSWSSISRNSPASETGVSRSVANWGTIPSVLVLPYHPGNTLIGYSQKVNELATMLGLTEALFVEDRDDIHHLTLLSRPDVLFLVPPREVIELIATLETHASSYFSAYQNLRKHKNRGASLRGVRFLSEVSVLILERFLAEEPQPEGAGTVDDLDVLYSLRQARSYALYDGYETSIEYLEHYARRATSQTLTVLQSVLEEVRNFHYPTKKIVSQSHPMMAALENSFKRMEQDMLSQAPSLQSIHRRYQFRPLVITNSKEAYEGLMKSLEKANDILQAGQGDVALCELRHLSGTKGKKTDYERQAYEASTDFSHVYHVIDDRNRQSHNDLLPPHLLQYVHAGRTRLLTIAVDETRELESIYNDNEVLYGDLSAALEAADTSAQQLRRHAYMKQVSLQDVISSLNTLVFPSEGVVKGTNPVTIEGPGTLAVNTRREHSATRVRKAKKPATISELQISVAEICQSSIADLRSILKTRLDSIRGQNIQGTLDVFIKIGASERCTPATTYLFAAIAGDADLLNHTKVRTLFQY